MAGGLGEVHIPGVGNMSTELGGQVEGVVCLHRSRDVNRSVGAEKVWQMAGLGQ